MEGYKVGKVGFAQDRKTVAEQSARTAMKNRLESLGGKQYVMRYPGRDWTWGPPKNLGDALDTMFHNVADIGDKAQVKRANDKRGDDILVLIHAFSSLGPEVVQIALDQLGDEYTWASAGPNAFDCSGLVLYCYLRVGISFPIHSADAIMKNAQVERCAREQVRDGDLIGYHVGRLGAGNFDHIGVACRRDNGDLWVIDASSSADKVVFRDADSNPIMAYGYVPSVTGPR